MIIRSLLLFRTLVFLLSTWSPKYTSGLLGLLYSSITSTFVFKEVLGSCIYGSALEIQSQRTNFPISISKSQTLARQKRSIFDR